MEFVMWIVVWMIGGVLALASIPVLVVGTWFVIMTLILGIADAGIWILDLARTIHERLLQRPILLPGVAFLVWSPRRTASTPASLSHARSL